MQLKININKEKSKVSVFIMLIDVLIPFWFHLGCWFHLGKERNCIARAVSAFIQITKKGVARETQSVLA